MISCVLLSAGLSTRFGSSKALALLEDKTSVIKHVQQMLILSAVDEIVIVLGALSEKIKPHVLKHTKIKVVYNKDYNLGQTSSFKAGLQAVSPQSQGLMLLPVDYPFVRSETVDLLINEFYLSRPDALVPTYNAQKGHPPVFSFSLRSKFLELDNGSGINTVIHQQFARFLPVNDEGIVLTFNTPEEFGQIKKQIKK